MKTNKTMRIASIILVAVLLSTCAISGTFAKYISTDSTTDNARVAYWGWGSDTITAEIDLFDGNYTDVVSADSANVVAPGTAKSSSIPLQYNVNGETKAPEVDYKYDVKAEATSTNGYDALDANANFKWTLTNAEGTKNTYNTVADLVAAINALSEAKIEAGNLPAGYAEDGSAAYEIGWAWTFETADDADQDAEDTAMGNDTTPDDVTITITITVTQLDGTPIA